MKKQERTINLTDEEAQVCIDALIFYEQTYGQNSPARALCFKAYAKIKGREMGSEPARDDQRVVYETVCTNCRKVAVLRTHVWNDYNRSQRPIDGKVYIWECPDGCNAGLTRARYVPEDHG